MAKDDAKPTQIYGGTTVWCTLGRCSGWVGDRATGLDNTPTGDPDKLNEFERHMEDVHGLVHPSSESLRQARSHPRVAAAFADAERLQQDYAEVIERAKRGYKNAGMVGYGDIDMEIP